MVAVIALAALTWWSGAVSLRATALPDDERVPVPSVRPSTGNDDSGSLTLLADGASGTLRRAVQGPVAPGSQLRFSGRLVRSGSPVLLLDPATRPLVYLHFLDAAGELVDYGAVVRALGPRRTLAFDTLSTVPLRAVSAELVFRVPGSGVWQLAGARVQRVVPVAAYDRWWWGVASGWACLAIAALAGGVRRVSFRSGASAGLAIVGIFVLVALSRDHMGVLLQPIAAATASVLPDSLVPSVHGISKIGHAIAFGLLTACLLTIRRQLALGIGGIAVLCAALAFATEAWQRHIPGRSAEGFDLAIDSIGIATAVLLWAVFEHRPRIADGMVKERSYGSRWGA